MNNLQIAAYYFPNYHLDPRNAALHGPGWSEWELVKKARPRFPGHAQPKVPLWGYEDEADPQVMARKIETAAAYGIDAFLFDWYYYNDGTFLERALTEGFQKAPNCGDLKYALMWANHNWLDLHPKPAEGVSKLLYSGAVTASTFERMTDYIIEKHFKHPSYWKINGCPYFSIYEIYRLAEGFGGWNHAAEMLRKFRAKAQDAGFEDIHLNSVLWGVQLLPGENTVTCPAEIVRLLGFNSVTSYVWIHHAQPDPFPRSNSRVIFEKNLAYWEYAKRTFPVPYYPNVTAGWDTSPRTVQDVTYLNTGYPFMSIMEQTPQEFGEALRKAADFSATLPEGEKILTINAWNEWTEGSYLEPDTLNGYALLEEIAKVKDCSEASGIQG